MAKKRCAWVTGLATLALIVLGSLLACAVEPIFIYGDDDFVLSYPWIPGSGTEDDPYLVGNLSIEVTRGGYGTRSDYGIWIENTTVWVVIEDCVISYVASASSMGGIVLRNCRNVAVRRCDLHDNRIALRIERSTGILVEENKLLGNGYGVLLDHFSEDNVFTGNRFDNAINATVHRPNRWHLGSKGNCWSDLDLTDVAYVISRGNEDPYPLSLDRCEYPPDTSPPRFPEKAMTPLVLEAQEELDTVIVGVQKPNPDFRVPFVVELAAWECSEDGISFEIVGTGTEGFSRYLLQLYIGEILGEILISLPPGIELPLVFLARSSAGEILRGVLPAELVSYPHPPTSILQILRAIEVEGEPHEGETLFGSAPTTLEEIRARAFAVVQFSVRRAESVVVRVYPSLEGHKAKHDLEVMYYLPIEATPEDLAMIRDEAKASTELMKSLIPDVADITVSAFGNYHGLLYRGEWTSDPGANWVELFVSPVFIQH